MKKLILAIAIIASHNTFAAFAAPTQVETPDGQISIERLIPGDNIFTAKEGSVPTKIEKKSLELIFVNSEELRGLYLMKVSFNKWQSLIMTLDQTVLTENGNFIQARNLNLNNFLIDSEGNKVQINSIEVGVFEGRIVDIAPKSEFVTENIFLANGVWVGSFKVNLHIGTGRESKAFINQTF